MRTSLALADRLTTILRTDSVNQQKKVSRSPCGDRDTPYTLQLFSRRVSLAPLNPAATVIPGVPVDLRAGDEDRPVAHHAERHEGEIARL